MPVILATQEVEIGRISVQGHPRQKDSETPISTIAGCGGSRFSS
jgi:hypothetical protein